MGITVNKHNSFRDSFEEFLKKVDTIIDSTDTDEEKIHEVNQELGDFTKSMSDRFANYIKVVGKYRRNEVRYK